MQKVGIEKPSSVQKVRSETTIRSRPLASSFLLFLKNKYEINLFSERFEVM